MEHWRIDSIQRKNQFFGGGGEGTAAAAAWTAGARRSTSISPLLLFYTSSLRIHPSHALSCQYVCPRCRSEGGAAQRRFAHGMERASTAPVQRKGQFKAFVGACMRVQGWSAHTQATTAFGRVLQVEVEAQTAVKLLPSSAPSTSDGSTQAQTFRQRPEKVRPPVDAGLVTIQRGADLRPFDTLSP